MATKFFLTTKIGQVKLPVTKCHRPSFKNINGHTWDAGRIMIDGVECKAHLDTSWGHFIYFQHGEKMEWHKVRMFTDARQNAKYPEKNYQIDPFAKEVITTKS